MNWSELNLMDLSDLIPIYMFCNIKSIHYLEKQNFHLTNFEINLEVDIFQSFVSFSEDAVHPVNLIVMSVELWWRPGNLNLKSYLNQPYGCFLYWH